MNLFLESLSVVFPMFSLLALGYVLRLCGMFDDEFLKKLNNFCFKVFLTTILFQNIYQSDFQKDFSLPLLILAFASVLLSFLLPMLIVPRFERDPKRRGVEVQGIFRSNFILFGIPMCAALFGEDNLSVVSILIAFVVPLYNVLAVVSLSAFSDQKVSAKRVLLDIVKNPLIIASLVAFFVVATGIRLPSLLEKSVSDVAKVATPLSLIVLGGSFTFRGALRHRKPVLWSVVGRLILIPAIIIPITVALGFRDEALGAILAMSASPTAVSSFTMAQSMGADGELAGEIVVAGTAAAVLTIFLWVMLLKSFGML